MPHQYALTVIYYIIAEFCEKVKFDVIQMLPLNDINTDNSPFSPVSAFALNPLFISLTKLENYEKQTEEMARIVRDLQQSNSNPRIDWQNSINNARNEYHSTNFST